MIYTADRKWIANQVLLSRTVTLLNVLWQPDGVGVWGRLDARIYVTECIAVHLNYLQYYELTQELSKHVSSKFKKLKGTRRKENMEGHLAVKLQRVTTGKFPLLVARERCRGND